MKLPVVKNMVGYLEDHDQQELFTAVDVLEHYSQARGLSDEEMEVVGEIISNVLGAVEVKNKVDGGERLSNALNDFMKRVQGSIDTE